MTKVEEIIAAITLNVKDYTMEDLMTAANVMVQAECKSELEAIGGKWEADDTAFGDKLFINLDDCMDTVLVERVWIRDDGEVCVCVKCMADGEWLDDCLLGDFSVSDIEEIANWIHDHPSADDGSDDDDDLDF